MMVRKTSGSSLVALISLALIALHGIKRARALPADSDLCEKSERHPHDVKGETTTPALAGKKPLLVLGLATVLVIGGFCCVVRLTKSALGKHMSPPRVLRPQPANTGTPVIVKCGFYPVRIYDLDSSEGSFKADFYIWLKYDKAIPAPEDYLSTTDSEKAIPRIERLEANNGEAMDIERQDYSPKDKPEYRIWFRARGKFYHNFDLRDYPFDKQVLEISLENPIYPADQIQYVIDKASSHTSLQADGLAADLDPELLTFSGWQTERIQHVVRDNHYLTDWGLPDEPELQEYSRNTLLITLKRRSGQHLAEIMFPLIAAALLATLVFFHSNKDLSAAIWICVAMFISVVGHHRGLLVSMPDVRYFIKSDFFFLLTYLYIIACLTMILFSDYYSRKGLEQSAKRICCVSRVVLPIFYLLLMFVVTLPLFKG